MPRILAVLSENCSSQGKNSVSVIKQSTLGWGQIKKLISWNVLRIVQNGKNYIFLVTAQKFCFFPTVPPHELSKRLLTDIFSERQKGSSYGGQTLPAATGKRSWQMFGRRWNWFHAGGKIGLG